MVVSTDVTWESVLVFREVLRESNLPLLIDVMAWSVIPDSFKDETNQYHIKVYPYS